MERRGRRPNLCVARSCVVRVREVLTDDGGGGGGSRVRGGPEALGVDGEPSARPHLGEAGAELTCDGARTRIILTKNQLKTRRLRLKREFFHTFLNLSKFVEELLKTQKQNWTGSVECSCWSRRTKNQHSGTAQLQEQTGINLSTTQVNFHKHRRVSTSASTSPTRPPTGAGSSPSSVRPWTNI